MSEYFDYDDNSYEKEPEVEIPNGTQEVKVSLSINAGLIEEAISSHVNKYLEEKIKWMVNKEIRAAMGGLLKKDSYSDSRIKESMNQCISKMLLERYPDVVENKINEFEKAIRELNFKDARNSNSYSMDALFRDAVSRLKDTEAKANKVLNDYIENEMKDSVSKSKEYIEQFSRNYFAQNLFRAMEMIDKMIPQTENIVTKG